MERRSQKRKRQDDPPPLNDASRPLTRSRFRDRAHPSLIDDHSFDRKTIAPQLQALAAELERYLKSQTGFRGEAYYLFLLRQRRTLENTTSLSPAELQDVSGVSLPYVLSSQLLPGHEYRNQVEDRFEALEKVRLETYISLYAPPSSTRRQTRAGGARPWQRDYPKPSTLAYQYYIVQRNRRLAFRTGYPLYTLPTEPELISPGVYLYQLLQDRATQSAPHIEELADFRDAFKAARMVFKTVPSARTHSIKEDMAKAALEVAVPNNEGFCWTKEQPVYKGCRASIDVARIHQESGISLTFVEIKLLEGSGGDPFYQSNGYYAISIREFAHLREISPLTAFFISFVGNYVKFATALCDTLEGPHIARRVVGSVELLNSDDLEMIHKLAYSFWCYRQAILRLEAEFIRVYSSLKSPMLPSSPSVAALSPLPSRICNAPLVGLAGTGLAVIETLIVGRLHCAIFSLPIGETSSVPGLPTLLGNHSLLPSSPKNPIWLVEVSPRRQRYCTDAHMALAAEGYAPAYLCSFSPRRDAILKEGELPWIEPEVDPILTYHAIQPLLAPAEPMKKGWIPLESFKRGSISGNVRSKLINSLDRIQTILVAQGIFAPDSPNEQNIYIHVKWQKGRGEDATYVPLQRTDQDSAIDIRLTDFRRAAMKKWEEHEAYSHESVVAWLEN
ncbi:hypothetical protein CVT26_008410 [Gymnopilus dilepis]|uniref:Uncharacterized protein n=1 Tax=Gymnopilus dilepis TaxID=231916 RepID=A0A409X2E5_9AGAR|nr:hypothetical protein CVT26_008410 [Gymnopilus dilepis]